MDLSLDSANLHGQNSRCSENSGSTSGLSEILDLSNLNFDDEETWLYEPSQKHETAQDWPFEENKAQFPMDLGMPKLNSTKGLNTRTFTRPKKKYTRPSINDIEQMYLSDGNDMNSSNEDTLKALTKVQEEQEQVPSEPKPLQFDLSQPTSHNFDSFIFNNSDIDSFQNMSPPSLVNSLCSSTFANLMESSFIKNDPVLREIRDKDFTETAMLQDIEAPLFQSITESFSSLNSDSPESFLKKVQREHTFRSSTNEDQNLSADSTMDNQNATFQLDATLVTSSPSNQSQSSASTKSNNLNGTYRRTPKNNGTFRKSDLKKNRLSLNLNLTYEPQNDLNQDISKSIENDMNNRNKGSSEDLNSTRTKSSSKTVILHSDSIEELKKRFSSSEGSVDLNRLSYNLDEKEDRVNVTYKEDKIASELNRTVEIKRSSLGSADSLDRMSSLSSSSKGSNKVLSIEDVEAIVEMQERSLTQVMSTPKGPIVKKTLWDHNFISPIVSHAKDTLSDSELSDDYKSVKSQVSSKVSLDTWVKPLAANKDIKLKTHRTSYTISSQKPLQALPNNIRGSYSNISTLKNTTTRLGGSQQNLYRAPPSNPQPLRPPTSTSSNLKTLNTKLKGSYTSLRPISATLPVVPPVGATLNDTHTITRPNTGSRKTNSKVEVDPAQSSNDNTFVKPQQITRTSGLPRPTGIPRPSASRIPGPRSSNIRPSASSRNMNY